MTDDEPTPPSVAVLTSRVSHAVGAIALPIALLFATIFAARVIMPPIAAMMPIALVFGLYAAYRRLKTPRKALLRGPLEVRDGLVVAGHRPIAHRGAVKSGLVFPHPTDGVLVRLSGGPVGGIDLAVANVRDGRRVLEALSLDPSHATAKFLIRSMSVAEYRTRAQLAMLGAFAVVFLAIWTEVLRNPLVAMFMPFFVLFAVLPLMLPARATVGTDGIEVRTPFKSRFIPLEGIIDARVADGDPVFNSDTIVVRLIRVDGSLGEELLVATRKRGPMQRAADAAIRARAEAIAERIREAIAARNRAAEVDRAALARNGREVHAWLEDLRTLLSRAGTFREAEPPSIEALAAVVENASLPPETRAAAAAVLSSCDEEVRQRVRVAAEATAAPHLRVALSAAAEDDVARWAEAMEEMERAAASARES